MEMVGHVLPVWKKKYKFSPIFNSIFNKKTQVNSSHLSHFKMIIFLINVVAEN